MTFLVPQLPQVAGGNVDSWRVLRHTAARANTLSVHFHDGYEFMLNIHSTGRYQLGQRVIRLRPYQLLAIRPNQPHGPIGQPFAPGEELLVVQINAAMLAQLHFAGTSVRQIVERCCEHLPETALLSPQDYLQLKAIATLIRPPEEVVTPLERMEVMGALSVLLSRFCQALTDARLLERNMAQDSHLQDVYNHILERFSEDCSLEALAERFNISKYHLSHRFTQAYGMSLHQFVLHCRMAYAQLLIRQGEPMMSIAYQCGFNDYSTFVRAFTRFNGASPRVWRKQQSLPLVQMPLI